MKKIRILIIVLSMMFLASCSSLVSKRNGGDTKSSSLVEFLYPGKSKRYKHKAEVPVLNLPVNIGLAFVPTKNRHGGGIHSQTQIQLLEKVKTSFMEHDYIDRIEVIPSANLQGGSGFSTMEQVARLYDVDVMALVSYDQIARSFENNAALLYWTIVGMYVIPGNENSIRTFVDIAVFDVKSRKMLFRAPGVNSLKKRSTAVGVDETFAEKSFEGFTLAVADMTGNLNDELARFKSRVKKEKVATIQTREGYSGGGGSFGIFVIALLFAVRHSRTRRCDA